MKLFLYSSALICVSYDKGKPQVRPLLDNGFTYSLRANEATYFWDADRIMGTDIRDEE